MKPDVLAWLSFRHDNNRCRLSCVWPKYELMKCNYRMNSAIIKHEFSYIQVLLSLREQKPLRHNYTYSTSIFTGVNYMFQEYWVGIFCIKTILIAVVCFLRKWEIGQNHVILVFCRICKSIFLVNVCVSIASQNHVHLGDASRSCKFSPVNGFFSLKNGEFQVL